MFSYDLTPTGMERAEEVIRKYGGDPTVFRTPTKVTAE